MKACLEDHQHALEHIMQKYREHTQQKIKETKLDFTAIQNTDQVEIIQKQSQKIEEMAAIMRKACEVDQDKINKEHEYLSQLIMENKVRDVFFCVLKDTNFNDFLFFLQGLREMLEISQKFGDNRMLSSEDKSTQTEESQLNDSWSPNKPPLKSS